MEYGSAVRAALAAVDEDLYTRRPDGGLVTQSTAASAITEALARLDVSPGMRVLEIGTGSGFSGALLSELAGPAGEVVSVEVMADLSARAADLHRGQGRRNVVPVVGDGLLGAPGHGRFDRVVAWARPELVPGAWAAQAVPGALLVLPVDVTARAKAGAMLRARVDADGVPHGEALFEGGYVELHAEVLDQWWIPPRGVGALVEHGATAWWLSAGWAAGDRETAERVLRELAAEGTRTPVLAQGEGPRGIAPYLYATRAEELCTVGAQGLGWGLGYADRQGAAVFTPGTGEVLHAGDGSALARLRGWAADWRGAGRPGYAELVPVLSRVGNGWRVRATM
ncbi:protein-L-isoaspartate O-methyltransferase [Nocardiopsis sp. CC223A]|uniref:protein-L-isoaspartate O-methyltransferase family protein n=1 Tax=Nocardiopsis sp. CC223A TaxID=3044051 RepID=UPI00278C7F0A|nr:fibrillarin-like rRNA/tRNA 2'-O-methyltransferase [Nocardiopsis sp. CC223A]